MRFNILSPQIQHNFAAFRYSLVFFGFFRITPKIITVYLSGGSKPNPKEKLIQMAAYGHLTTKKERSKDKFFKQRRAVTSRCHARKDFNCLHQPDSKKTLIQITLYRHLRGVLSLRAADTQATSAQKQTFHTYPAEFHAFESRRFPPSMQEGKTLESNL